MEHTVDAGHHCGNRQGCLRGTRKAVLQEIEHWFTDMQSQPVFWLNGPAGTGKSTIAQTFAEMAFANGKLGASFFCSQDSEGRSDLHAIFPTLAFQLAHRYPLFRKELLQVLRATPDVRQVSLCSQMEKLIVGPLKVSHIPTLIIIDSLDECRGKKPTAAILSILSRYVHIIPSVKFFITGQPESRIHSGFHLESLVPITEVLKSYEVKPEAGDSDIELFFQTRLIHLAKNRSDCDLTQDWPSSSDIEILCKKAAGFFVCASTIVNFIMSENHSPVEQLRRITSLPQSTPHEQRLGIDILYSQVLEEVVVDIGVDDEELYSHFRTVVGVVLLVFNPLSVKALSDLLGVSGIPVTLHSLDSLLLVPTNEATPIRIYHKSFPNFLVDLGRCKDHRFFINPSVHHVEILLSCLTLMRGRLKGNICNLDDCAMLGEVRDLPTRRKSYIGDALEYACCFWTNHLVNIPITSPNIEEVQKAIGDFFKMHLLFWIEALSLLGDLDVGVYSLNNIQQWYQSVSGMWSIQRNLYLYFFRQDFPASGQLTASVFSWKTLIPYATLLLRYTILPSHSALPHHGFASTTLQNSYKRLWWLRDYLLNGEHVPVQLLWTRIHGPLCAGKTPLQLVCDLVILLSLMQSLEFPSLSFLDTVMM